MPSTLPTRLRLRGLWTLLAVLALVASTSAGALAQDATPVATPQASPTAAGDGPALGDAVVLFDERGRELAQVAILDVVDPFEETTSGARRGYHYVAVEVVVENLSDQDVYPVDIYGLRLVDTEGTLYTNTYVGRTEDSRAATADLAGAELEPGAATSGYLLYEIVDATAPAAVVATDGYETFTLLADLTGVTPTAGAPTTLYDDRGDEVGTISLDETLPALEDTSDAFDVSRGETVLGVVVTIENTGDAPITPDLYSMYVVDEFGYLYNATTFYRDAEEAADQPEFPSEDIAAGDSASGLVAFTLPTEVQVSYVVYVPGGGQLFVVAQPGDGSVVSGDVLTPVPPVVEDDGSDDTGTDDASPVASAECAELTDWSDATQANLAVLDELDVLQADTAAGVTPSDLRDAAVEIRDAAESQADLDVPALAADTNDAIVGFLDTFADALDDGADKVEGGADPEEIFSEELVAEGSDLGQALTDLVEAQTTLQTTCPDVEIGL